MIHIKIYDLLTPEAFEKLEDNLRDFLEKEKLKADIFDEVTGNTTKTRSKMRKVK